MFRLATLRGHLEAGQVAFRAAAEQDGTVWFTVETWARPSGRLVDLLYTRLLVGREIQLNMWMRCCLSAAHSAGGHARGGVDINTRILPAEQIPRAHTPGAAMQASG
jgi:hypothetical protein